MPETAGAQSVGGVNVGVASRVRVGSLTADLAVVGAAAFVLGILRLGAQSLWIDESLTWTEIRRSYWSYVDGYYWLYYSVERPWTLVAGTSEWALRFPSVVGSVLACTLMVLLGRRLFDRRVGLVSGLLLATSPFVVQWSQQARGYTFLLALAVLATLLLVRALDRGDRGAWALYGLAMSALIVWHPVGGALMVVPHLVLAARSRDRLSPHGLLAVAVVMALGVPWAAQVAMRSTGEGVAMNWLKFPSAETAGRTLLDVSGIAGLGVLFAVAGLWVLRRQGRADAALWVGAWAFTPFLVALVVSVERPIYLDRYLIVAAPAFALLAATALLGSRGWTRSLAVTAVVVATSVGLVRWYGTADGGNWHGEDWRQAVATLLQRKGAADAVVVADWSAAPAARYYGANVTDLSEAPRIWVLRWSETGRPLTAEERSSLGFGGHRLVERIPFGRRLSLQLWAVR
jgi:mannosyltransferase